jgi:hypothetical protein
VTWYEVFGSPAMSRESRAVVLILFGSSWTRAGFAPHPPLPFPVPMGCRHVARGDPWPGDGPRKRATAERSPLLALSVPDPLLPCAAQGGGTRLFVAIPSHRIFDPLTNAPPPAPGS